MTALSLALLDEIHIKGSTESYFHPYWSTLPNENNILPCLLLPEGLIKSKKFTYLRPKTHLTSDNTMFNENTNDIKSANGVDGKKEWRKRYGT
eukprot:UN08343